MSLTSDPLPRLRVLARGQTGGLGPLFSCLSFPASDSWRARGAVVASGRNKVGEPSMCVGSRGRDLSKGKSGQDLCKGPPGAQVKASRKGAEPLCHPYRQEPPAGRWCCDDGKAVGGASELLSPSGWGRPDRRAGDGRAPLPPERHVQSPIPTRMGDDEGGGVWTPIKTQHLQNCCVWRHCLQRTQTLFQGSGFSPPVTSPSIYYFQGLASGSAADTIVARSPRGAAPQAVRLTGQQGPVPRGDGRAGP